MAVGEFLVPDIDSDADDWRPAHLSACSERDMRAESDADDGGLGSPPNTSNAPVPSSETVLSPSDQDRDGDDQESFRERVVAEFRSQEPRLRSMIEKRIAPRLQGRVDVDVMFQEALTGLLKSIDSKRPESVAELRSWIFKKVWSRWHDELRKWSAGARDAGREEELPAKSDMALVGGIGVATNLCLKEWVERIRQILSPVDFVIVELKIVDEMSIRDLSELVGLSEEAVKKRFARALLKVKQVISSPFNSSW